MIRFMTISIMGIDVAATLSVADGLFLALNDAVACGISQTWCSL
jgi:Na+(H+)/acetate symporter ActP